MEGEEEGETVGCNEGAVDGAALTDGAIDGLEVG